jgi:hypothetical protein
LREKPLIKRPKAFDAPCFFRHTNNKKIACKAGLNLNYAKRFL